MIDKEQCGELLPCGWCVKFDKSCEEICVNESEDKNNKYTVRNILNLIMGNTYVHLNFHDPDSHEIKGLAEDIRYKINDIDANRVVEYLQADSRWNKKGMKLSKIIFEIE